jgi:hypothetical protein
MNARFATWRTICGVQVPSAYDAAYSISQIPVRSAHRWPCGRHTLFRKRDPRFADADRHKPPSIDEPSSWLSLARPFRPQHLGSTRKSSPASTAHPISVSPPLHAQPDDRPGKPSSLAMVLMVRPLSVCARNKASSQVLQTLNHRARLPVERRAVPWGSRAQRLGAFCMRATNASSAR